MSRYVKFYEDVTSSSAQDSPSKIEGSEEVLVPNTNPKLEKVRLGEDMPSPSTSESVIIPPS